MAPAHLFGPEMIDIVLRDDSGFGGVAGRRHEMRLRCNRPSHSLRAP
jgi:hypothetical protein